MFISETKKHTLLLVVELLTVTWVLMYIETSCVCTYIYIYIYIYIIVNPIWFHHPLSKDVYFMIAYILRLKGVRLP